MSQPFEWRWPAKDCVKSFNTPSAAVSRKIVKNFRFFRNLFGIADGLQLKQIRLVFFCLFAFKPIASQNPKTNYILQKSNIVLLCLVLGTCAGALRSYTITRQCIPRIFRCVISANSRIEKFHCAGE